VVCGDAEISMTRQQLVLAMLAAAQGRPYTPVQIQKAIFLAVNNIPGLIDSGPQFNFEPYDYGPFDASVYVEAEGLAAAGLAVIAPSGVGRWNTYSASDLGLASGTGFLNQMSASTRGYLAEVSEWVRKLSFSSLVKSIYDAYPDMRANSIFRG
jgi:hypothetical protein